LFARLEEARADLEAQAEAIEATSVEGHAAGGAVVIRLTGSLEAESVHIDPSLVDPTDPTLLEDAVLAALQDALDRITELRSSVQSSADAAGGLDLGGFVGNLDLGGLFAGVDIQGLMGNLGMGQDLGALSGFGALAQGEDEDDGNEDPAGGAGDEPQA
jgi:DNA-binding YbaB/EbfC family protein